MTDLYKPPEPRSQTSAAAGPQVVQFSAAAAVLREPVDSRYPLAISRIHGMPSALVDKIALGPTHGHVHWDVCRRVSPSLRSSRWALDKK